MTSERVRKESFVCEWDVAGGRGLLSTSLHKNLLGSAPAVAHRDLRAHLRLPVAERDGRRLRPLHATSAARTRERLLEKLLLERITLIGQLHAPVWLHARVRLHQEWWDLVLVHLLLACLERLPLLEEVALAVSAAHFREVLQVDEQAELLIAVVTVEVALRSPDLLSAFHDFPCNSLLARSGSLWLSFLRSDTCQVVDRFNLNL